MSRRAYEDVRVEGHLIDSLIVSQIMDDVVALDAEFEVLSFDVGRTNDDPSVAKLRVTGRDEAHLDEVLSTIQQHGAVPVEPDDVECAPALAHGVFPQDFYSTTNLVTHVRLGGRWVRVEDPEMDCGIVVDPQARSARTVPMSDVRKDESIVVGRRGLRVTPLERPRETSTFEFMSSTVSSEKPKAQVVDAVARLLREVRGDGGTVVAVVGPAVVHTGAARHVARLVEQGYVTVLFGGNAVAVHDIEAAMFGTSLGVDLESGLPTPGGHEHHLRAINAVRASGSIEAAVEDGTIERGLMHTCVRTGTPFVLAGSIRDDGPLPDVVTDAVEAQRAMRAHARDAGACLMLGSMLHSIAAGNLLPASTHVVCVDINPAVVTKLADRGSFQTTGVVTDAGLFLALLADELDGD
jgi:lysine-ketoglutarate reductase/saccharopine dehydrogenase-like protein (TIGR00300 family)